MNDCIRTVALPNGEEWPALGLGTWRMGESPARRAAEVAVLRQAFRRAVALEPDNADLHIELGIALGRQGRHIEAEVDVRQRHARQRAHTRHLRRTMEIEPTGAAHHVDGELGPAHQSR